MEKSLLSSIDSNIIFSINSEKESLRRVVCAEFSKNPNESAYSSDFTDNVKSNENKSSVVAVVTNKYINMYISVQS